MDVVSTVMALFFMLLAVWSQSQLVALQQSSEAAPSLESPPSLEILYSRRVVTRGTTISAAVHISDGRVQSIVPMKTAPKGPKVRSTATHDHPTGGPDRSTPRFSPIARSSTTDLTFASKLVSVPSQVTDYGALVISPGLVDIHVHLNEPGREEWEGFETGTKAAAAGGVTTVVDMPLNSYPTICDAATFDGKLAASEGKLHVDVAFWGGLVPQNAHNESVLDELIERGVVGLKTFMSPSGIGDFEQSFKPDLEAALKTLGKHQVPLMAHAELPSDVDLDPNADPRKYATYLATRPRKWEQVRTLRNAHLLVFSARRSIASALVDDDDS